jgi:hypothetical protein
MTRHKAILILLAVFIGLALPVGIISLVAYSTWVGGTFASRTGNLSVTADGMTVELWLKGKWGCLRFDNADSNVVLPVGSYSLRAVRLTAKAGDADSATWTLNGDGPWGKLKSFSISAGETTELRLGPPFAYATLPKPRGDEVCMTAVLVGQAGERYSPYVAKGGEQIPLPKIHVTDSAGNVIGHATLAHG